MLVKSAIERIRKLSGYYQSGIDSGDGSVEVNSNMVIQSINNTLKYMLEKQYRPFLKSFSFNEHDLIGSDLFNFGMNYNWNSKIPSSSKVPARQYLPIPTKLTSTNVGFFYDSKRRNGSTMFLFNRFYQTYFPDEYATRIGTLNTYRTITINPPDSITMMIESGISTFRTEFLFFGEDRKLLDRWVISMNSEKSLTYKSSTGVFLRVDFDENFIECVYTSGTLPIVIEYRSHENYASCGSMLIYDGKLRMAGAKNGGLTNGFQVQAYCLPYYVLDELQHIPQEVSGELYELFCYLAAKDVQTQTRSIDSELNQIVEDKLVQYQGLLDLKNISESSYFPNLSL